MDKPALQVRTWRPDEDYPVFCGWWKAHGVPCVGIGLLPACGLVVESGGAPVLAAWLYQDNSCGVGWLGWFVGDPLSKHAARAVPILLGAAEEVMRSQKRHSLLVMTDKRGLGRMLERHGYQKAHPATEYWRKL